MCRYRGLAPALEPVLLLQPGHAVILRAVEEDRTVVLTDLIALTCGDWLEYYSTVVFISSDLPDVLDGLDHDIVLDVVPHDAGVAGVVEQGEGGVHSRPDVD